MAFLNAYKSDGYAGRIPVLSREEAAMYRQKLEAAEARLGSLHFKPSLHTLLKSAHELAAHPAILDAVEAVIGPNIMLYDATFIIKEANDPAYVSWHQDLTYWGLSHTEKVTSTWLAITDATPENGCMKMVPGSHKLGQQEHLKTYDDNNVLYMGQEVTGVDVNSARPCSLKSGEASIHHGWTVHSSLPNTTADRRIGFNAQYIAPEVYNTAGIKIPALLMRGENKFDHFETEIPAEGEADAVSMARHEQYSKTMVELYHSQHA